MLSLALVVLPPLLIGWLLLRLVFPTDARWRALAFGLAPVLGIGACALLHQMALELGLHGAAVVVAAEAAATIGLGIAYAIHRRPSQDPLGAVFGGDPGAGVPVGPPGPRRALAAVVAGLSAATLWLFVITSRGLPHGGGDAWMIWNLRARFLHRGGAEGLAAATRPEMALYHPDYPGLVPGFVARCWDLLGADPTVVPAAVAGVFTFAAALVLGGALALLRGATQGLLGAGLLLATAPWLGEGVSQQSDVPLAALWLAGLVLAAIAGRATGRPAAGLSALAGFALGLLPWTKNEGWVLAAIAIAVVAARAWRLGAARTTLVPLLAGAVPGVVVTLVFKLRHAPVNDLVQHAGGLGGLVERGLDGARHLRVAGHGLEQLGAYGLVWAVLLAAVLAGRPWRREPGRRGATVVVAAVVAHLAFVQLAYAMTPQDLTWHLQTSQARLLLHGWPATLLGLLLWAKPAGRVAPRDG